MSFACRISKLRMHCAWFSLANSGDCSPSSMSQIHRSHSDGITTFVPQTTAQKKPSRVDTSIAFSRLSSARRNASSSLISRLVSGPDLIGLIGQSHLITTTCGQITRLLDGNSAGAHPASRGIAWFARDSLKEGQVLIEQWRKHYNTIRPHSSLGYRPPAPQTMNPFLTPLDPAVQMQ